MAGQQPDLPSPRPATGRIQTSTPLSLSRGSGGFPWVSPTPGRAQSCPHQLPGSPPLQDTKAAPVQVQAGGDTALGPGSGPGAFWSQDGGDGLHPPFHPRAWGQLQQEPEVSPQSKAATPGTDPLSVPSPPLRHPPSRDPRAGTGWSQAASPHQPRPPPPVPRLTQCYTSLFINNIKYTRCFLLFSLNRLL